MSKVQLKIWMPHGTKKVRELPQTFQALDALVDSNAQDKNASRRIWYQDEAKDWITIADDDDLQLAYETAEQHFDGHLKVFVKPVEKKEE